MTPRCNRRRFVSPLCTKFDFPPLADALAGFSIDIGAALATGMVRPIWCDAANIGNFVNYRIIVGGITDGQTPDQFPRIGSHWATDTILHGIGGRQNTAPRLFSGKDARFFTHKHMVNVKIFHH